MDSQQLLDPLPVTAVFVLFAVMGLTTHEVGYRIGRQWQDVVDLDRPRQGFLQVSQQLLLDVERQIGPPGS